MVETQKYGTTKSILIANDSFLVSLPARIADTGITAVDGRKIVKAGTPLTGDITDRDTAMAKGTTNPVAVLLHDVDVTKGANNGTIILAGCIDLLKLESDVQTLITSEVKTALNNVIFVKGSAI